MTFRREWFLMFLSPLVLMGLGAGIIMQGRASRGPAQETTPGVHLFEEMMALARNSYVVEPDLERLIYGAARGIVEHGLDENCTVYDPAEWSAQNVRSRGEYAGIGVRIGRLRGKIAFLWVDPEGPSGRAGLRDGDVLIRIDGKDLDHALPAEEAAAPLRGEVGSRVEVTVAGFSETSERTVSVRRSLVEEQTSFGRMLDPAHRIAYVAITSFRDNTYAQFQTVMNSLREAGMESLILDLRGNRGGRLEAAVEVVDRFLSSGVILITRGRVEPEVIREARVESPDATLTVVILVDGTTASASEVVAGALQDHGHAILLGERTYGKGVVQRVIPFEESGYGGGVKMTVAHYFTPSGRLIERQVAMGKSGLGLGGLIPDVVIPVSPAQRDVHDRLRDRSRLSPTIRAWVTEADNGEVPLKDVHIESAMDILKATYRADRPLEKR